MRSFNHLLIALLILMGAAFTQAMRFSAGATGSIEGLVLDEKGGPIALCDVQASNIMHGGTNTATSQPNGFYRIVDLDGGKYSLWVEGKGHTSRWIPLVIVEDGRATKNDIHLERELALSKHNRHRAQ
jgi:hypothetical protein